MSERSLTATPCLMWARRTRASRRLRGARASGKSSRTAKPARVMRVGVDFAEWDLWDAERRNDRPHVDNIGAVHKAIDRPKFLLASTMATLTEAESATSSDNAKALPADALMRSAVACAPFHLKVRACHRSFGVARSWATSRPIPRCRSRNESRSAGEIKLQHVAFHGAALTSFPEARRSPTSRPSSQPTCS
jgi:hypothetical protein